MSSDNNNSNDNNQNNSNDDFFGAFFKGIGRGILSKVVFSAGCALGGPVIGAIAVVVANFIANGEGSDGDGDGGGGADLS